MNNFLLNFFELVSVKHDLSLLFLQLFFHMIQLLLVPIVELVVVELSTIELLLDLFLHKKFVLQLRLSLHLERDCLLPCFLNLEQISVVLLLLLGVDFGLLLHLAVEVLKLRFKCNHFLLPTAAWGQSWVIVVVKIKQHRVLLAHPIWDSLVGDFIGCTLGQVVFEPLQLLLTLVLTWVSDPHERHFDLHFKHF